MNSAPASSKQIGAIHALKARLGLDEDSYRDLLQAETGQRSAKGLSSADAWKVMEKLKLWTNPAPAARSAAPTAAGALKLSGPYAGICRVLWMAGYNLGIFEDRTDRALVAFVQRQGIQHLNWMREGPDAKKVIEALKSWISREAGIVWDAEASVLRHYGLSLVRYRKGAVLRAQIARLAELGEHGPWPSRAALDAMTDSELDTLTADLGRTLRRAQQRRRK